MPSSSAIEKRDHALIAFAILTGARDNALASFSLRHVDPDQCLVHQNAREVRTTLARLGLKLTTTEEEWSTWSLNLGHANVGTTYKAYATVPFHRHAEIMRRLSGPRPAGTISKVLPDALETIRKILS